MKYEINNFYNIDCMKALPEIPDNYFDLAIVDPPYGDALHADEGGGKGWFTKYNQKTNYWKNNDGTRFGGRFDKYKPEIKVNRNGGESHGWKQYDRKIIQWDIAPPEEYFEQLFRVSKNQIIWGGNYFDLPPTRCFIIWRKLTISENFTMAMAEYAWTSFNSNAKVFEKAPQGKDRFHPTQKPVELYKWLLLKYANKGDKILDTHVGSASSLIACYDLGFDYMGFEIDKEYYDKATERLNEVKAQIRFEL